MHGENYSQTETNDNNDSPEQLSFDESRPNKRVRPTSPFETAENQSTQNPRSGPRESGGVPPENTNPDLSLIQIPQLIPMQVVSGTDNANRPRANLSSGNGNMGEYDWDERDNNDAGKVDGMAMMASGKSGSGYLGLQSSASLLNVVQQFYPLDFDMATKSILQISSVFTNYTKNPVPSNVEVSDADVEYYIGQYFKRYHVSYPLVHQALFMAEYHEIVPQPGNAWNVLKYIVAAIGAFMSATSINDNADLQLFRMAKSHLSMDMLETGNLTLVQALALMSNYLQKRDRPNSGYNYLGLAVRISLALGLHKELPDRTISPFNLEIRRRVWWCLYIFDCGATITYGRPLGIPCAGVDTSLPSNVLETDIKNFTTSIPPQREFPTIYTSVRLQSQLHLMTNSIYERLISDPQPSAKELLAWDEYYMGKWLEMIPSYYKETADVPEPFAFSHSVLIWRYKNLRILMYRPFVLKKIFSLRDDVQVTVEMDEFSEAAFHKCLEECHNTILSIENHWNYEKNHFRMSAWYSLYFLIPAAMMPLLCLRNTRVNGEDGEWTQWQSDVLKSISIVESLCEHHSLGTDYLRILKQLSNNYTGMKDDDNLTTKNSNDTINGMDLNNQDFDSFHFSPTEDSPLTQVMLLNSLLWPHDFEIDNGNFQ
ncbi:hypothetical protein TRICI_000403 [Trichomonascus ciferrii]|uniref:Xylanolytic transcriptional activator regulatory domain-containing protein n=1 Tax=Trichomonascus ciferrii TaxID=44093 RepID=A0A642VDI9_9ASCO|nr:hypothetical protein TRICI_000403 [Trichomonascus ciferrii]